MNLFAIKDTEDFESVLELNFMKDDVLLNNSDKTKRRASLLKAATLESINPTEVILYIESDNGCQKIKSRVMATGDRQILIERGFAIPIHSIHKVEFTP